MASHKASHKKSMRAENESLDPIALSNNFGDEEDTMVIDSPAQNLKRLLEENAKKKVVHGNRTRESTKTSPRQFTPAEETTSVHLTKFRFWLGFEAMERIAKEQGIAELFTMRPSPIELQEASPPKRLKS